MTNIRIYQVNLDRDKDNVGFMGYETLPRFQGTQEPNPEIYDKVFEGSVDCASLESVYTKFNIDHPAGYCGRSLSVSDIVEVVEAPDVESGFYFCDSFGFKSVPFDSAQVNEKSDTIKVVLLEPGKLARITDIDASLEGMQKIVGGCIEAYYPFEEQVCIVCNDEGKLNGMDLNRAIREEDTVLDIIAGPCFICDCRGENFGSLSAEQLDRYTKKFKYPEQFFRVNGNIEATPYKPKNKDYER